MNFTTESPSLNHSMKITPITELDRRRTIRIKRSGFKKIKLGQLDRPAIKFAESKKELEKSFSLVYDTYEKKGFIPKPKPHKMLYSIYSLLPQTTHIIAKSYQSVISNLTEIFDTPEFGLPMDEIFKPEIDKIRDKGRKIVELSSLVTSNKYRWKNIFLYLVQVMYLYSLSEKIDDICVMINPRHKKFYMNLFPFEEIGSKRYYPCVNAPAIGLRGKVQESFYHMRSICNDLKFETSLYDYFLNTTGEKDIRNFKDLNLNDMHILIPQDRLKTETVNYFLSLEPTIIKNLTPKQMGYLQDSYPDLNISHFFSQNLYRDKSKKTSTIPVSPVSLTLTESC